MPAPVGDALGLEARLQVGVACSLVGRHGETLDLAESTLAARASHSDTVISYPESVGTPLAIARFLFALQRCNVLRRDVRGVRAAAARRGRRLDRRNIPVPRSRGHPRPACATG
jgi:hypothetical protein